MSQFSSISISLTQNITKQVEYKYICTEEKNNYKDLEGKKEERERFAEYNAGAAGGAKEGVKKLCLRRTLLRPTTTKTAFGADKSVSLKILKN